MSCLLTIILLLWTGWRSPASATMHKHNHSETFVIRNVPRKLLQASLLGSLPVLSQSATCQCLSLAASELNAITDLACAGLAVHRQPCPSRTGHDTIQMNAYSGTSASAVPSTGPPIYAREQPTGAGNAEPTGSSSSSSSRGT